RPRGRDRGDARDLADRQGATAPPRRARRAARLRCDRAGGGSSGRRARAHGGEHALREADRPRTGTGAGEDPRRLRHARGQRGGRRCRFGRGRAAGRRRHRDADAAPRLAGRVPAPRQPRAAARRGGAGRCRDPQVDPGALAGPARATTRRGGALSAARLDCRQPFQESAMRLTLLVLLSSLAMVAMASEPATYGEPLPADGKVVPISVAAADADAYAGVPHRFSGRITEVCQKEGCWMMLEDNGEAARVMMKDHAFAVPKDARGSAEVHGVLSVKELT